MTISQTLYTAITGISANSEAVSITANNISNAPGAGFKEDQFIFKSLAALDRSTDNKAKSRMGVQIDSITSFTQGGLKRTGKISDLAILGGGFFIVNPSNTDSNNSAGKLYSRAGNMHFDKEGYFVNDMEEKVLGYQANSDGKLSNKLSNIGIKTYSIAPKATSKINLNVNLDARSKVIDKQFDINNVDDTSNFSSAISIFDSHGKMHQATVFFKRIMDENRISWEWHSTVDGSEVIDGEKGKLKEIARGIVRFDVFGALLSEESNFSEVNFKNGALPRQIIEYDFGKNKLTEGGDGINASTSIASKSLISFHVQNGHEGGNLKSIDIGIDGIIKGRYTNGIEKPLAAIALASFSNQDSLKKAGKNRFYETSQSGPPKIGHAQSGNRGSLYSGMLEESNVNLVDQFVNIIMHKGFFAANVKSVKVADEMMNEIINLKRA